MKNITILFSVIASLLFSCSKKHIRTEKVCNQSLYMEIFERSQLGVAYLTDSANFKIYVWQLNFENEWYSYTCMGDSIVVLKYSRNFNNTNCIIYNFNYTIKELKRKK